MAKDPAFLFYYQDFLVGVEFMDDAEVGQYIRVLCHLADKQKLTKSQLLKICGTAEIPAWVDGKISVDKNGFFFNKRLAKEVKKRRQYIESRRRNRLKTTTKPDNISKTYDPSYDAHMENENEDESTNKNEVKTEYGEYVLLTATEHNKLTIRFGPEITQRAIEKLDHYKGSTGKKYKSDYRAILNWVIDEVTKHLPKQSDDGLKALFPEAHK